MPTLLLASTPLEAGIYGRNRQPELFTGQPDIMPAAFIHFISRVEPDQPFKPDTNDLCSGYVSLTAQMARNIRHANSITSVGIQLIGMHVNHFAFRITQNEVVLPAIGLRQLVKSVRTQERPQQEVRPLPLPVLEGVDRRLTLER